MSLQQCIAARAAFVMCPCCVGKLKLSALEYPRSKAVSALVPLHQFHDLAKAADYNKSVACEPPWV